MGKKKKITIMVDKKKLKKFLEIQGRFCPLNGSDISLTSFVNLALDAYTSGTDIFFEEMDKMQKQQKGGKYMVECLLKFNLVEIEDQDEMLLF